MCVCDVCPLRHREMCPVQQISIISYMTHLQSLLPLHSLSHTHTRVLYPLFFFFFAFYTPETEQVFIGSLSGSNGHLLLLMTP